MTPAQFEGLRKIAIETNGACPFVPYVGAGYEARRTSNCAPRVMVCGIATDGWGDPAAASNRSAELVAESGAAWVEKDVLTGKISRGFFNQIRKIVPEVFALEEQHIEQKYDLVIPQIVWNNLWKVGNAEGNPTTEQKRAQLDLSVASLRHELNALSPTFVWLHVGQNCYRIIESVFGLDDWDGMESSVWGKRLSNGMQVVWTPRRRIKDRLLADLVIKRLGEC